jgi:hypothetical protein
MADFDKVYDVIHSIASGFKGECVKCMEENKNVLIDCIQEQLYSGLDGTEHLLNPTYDNDTISMNPVPGKIKQKGINIGKRR